MPRGRRSRDEKDGGDEGLVEGLVVVIDINE